MRAKTSGASASSSDPIRATSSSGPSGVGRALERGLIERSRGEIRPTALGLRFLNDLVGLFLPDGGTAPPAAGATARGR